MVGNQRDITQPRRKPDVLVADRGYDYEPYRRPSPAAWDHAVDQPEPQP